MRVFLFLFLAFLEVQANPILLEAVVARVNNETVLLSDLRRYQEVVNLLICADLRISKDWQESEQKAILDSYINEELVYLAARNKKNTIAVDIKKVVEKIRQNSKCRESWLKLSETEKRLWNSKDNPKIAETMLLKELEKRSIIDFYSKTEITVDHSEWLKAARNKANIEVAID